MAPLKNEGHEEQGQVHREGAVEEGRVATAPQLLPRGDDARQRDLPEARQVPRGKGWQFKRKHFCFGFSLKNHLSFGLRFPTLRKVQKLQKLVA